MNKKFKMMCLRVNYETEKIRRIGTKLYLDTLIEAYYRNDKYKWLVIRKVNNGNQ